MVETSRPIHIVVFLGALCVVTCVASGCATVTGTLTGAFTGAVDLPAETYRHNRETFHEYPIVFGLDALILGPVGVVTGPVMGLAKGVALDVQWCAGQVNYGDVFGGYGPTSIWRPHTLQWPSKAPPAKP